LRTLFVVGDKQTSETKRTKNIAFRLNDEEFAQIEKAAIASGEDPTADNVSSKYLILMVGARGFEPPNSRSRTADSEEGE
jgi:hypothetical protein